MRGANLPVPNALIVAELSWRVAEGISFCCCLLGADGKVGGSSDLIGVGRTASAGGEVRLTATSVQDANFEVLVSALPARVTKVSFCTVADEQRALDCGSSGVELVLASQGSKLARFALPEERQTAAVVGELYRRNGDWKFRAVGQGYQEGLGRLAEVIGCEAADLRRVFTPAPPPSARPSPPVSRVPAEPAPSASPIKTSAGVDQGPAEGEISPPAPAPAPGSVRARPAIPAAQGMPTPPASPNSLNVASPATQGADGAGAEVFASRGWALTQKGVAPLEPRRGNRLLERELLDLRSGANGAQWPAFFAFDPVTGGGLPEPPPVRRTWGRYLGEEGWPELPSAGIVDPVSRQDETLPEGARFFAAGGSPARLVALNVADGQAWWKAPLSRKWVPMGRCPPGPADMPAFACGAVGTREGVFFGSDGGLVHLLVGQQSIIEEAPLTGWPLGPPAVLADSVFLPILTGAETRIAARMHGGAICEVGVEGAPAEQSYLGSPITNSEVGIVYWPGAKGFILLDQTEELVSARWHAWPAAMEAVQFLRPYRAKNGRLWIFGTRVSSDGLNRGAAVACCMTVKGARELKELPGPFLSVGAQCYRVRERYADPWAPALEEITLDYDYAGRWILPIFRIGEGETIMALVEDLGVGQGMREFLFREAAARPRQAVLAVHRDQAGLAILGQSFTISSTDDLELFLDGDRLCVHHFESNQCASWRLSSSR
jgi:stress response protein SCP2